MLTREAAVVSCRPLAPASLGDQEAAELARRLAAVADPKRVRLLVSIETNGCRPSSGHAPDELEATQLASGFAALADQARLRLFSLIAAQTDGEMCGCHLASPVGTTEPLVNDHLEVLYAAGLLNREKRGRWVGYRVVPERVEALRSAFAHTS
jgi:ArsR family transcriptional regulator